jgi:hypothetical protein
LVAAPQFEVEDRLELSGCRRGDELSAGVESAISNELVQSLGRQMGHESRQVWCVEQSGESLVNRTSVVGLAAAAGIGALRHEPAMVAVSPAKKQS